MGRLAAFTIGGAIILIEIAHEQGLLKVDWNKVTKKVDQVGDKVQEAVTGEGPKWMEKVGCISILFVKMFDVLTSPYVIIISLSYVIYYLVFGICGGIYSLIQ